MYLLRADIDLYGMQLASSYKECVQFYHESDSGLCLPSAQTPT